MSTEEAIYLLNYLLDEIEEEEFDEAVSLTLEIREEFLGF
jgi:hypothetical protein